MKEYLIGVGSRVSKVLQSDKWRTRCRWNREKSFNKGSFNFTAYSKEKKETLKLSVFIQWVRQDLKTIGNDFQLIVNILLSKESAQDDQPFRFAR